MRSSVKQLVLYCRGSDRDFIVFIMEKVVLSVVVVFLSSSFLTCAHPANLQEREDVSNDTVPDPDVILVPLVEAVEKYNVTETTRSTTGKCLTAYVLWATCYHIPFWIIDFTNLCHNGIMQIKYSTSLLTMPSTWINIRRNPFFSYRGHPTFTVVLGPYKPCTTVYIIARLKYGTTTRHLGIFSISTSCPCDPCICIGEPHFTTFEGMCFDFNSDCSYILSQTLQPDAHDFELTANLVSIGGGLSVIESADIVADNHIIYLLEDGTIEIDSQMCDGTAFVVDDLTVAVEIIDQYTQVVFSLTEGWWVLWIKNAKTGHNEIRFEIEDYSPLVGKQRGMLGPKYAANATHTFEGFIKKNGDTTHNIQEFCLSWQVINSCPT